MYIKDTQALRELVERLRGHDAVAIDTEFMREKTYYPQLCLIQLGTEEICAIVDPLACDDLSPLAELLEDPQVTKVFHASEQDLEILHHEVGAVTSPIFDTQKAAALVGHSQQLGYGALVQGELSILIKKGESFTDWAKRPLTDQQLSYACDDVIYLIQVYRRLLEKLQESGREAWLAQEFKDMSDPARYTIDFQMLWKRVKRHNSLTRPQLAVLRELAIWREETAQRRDIPRKWIMSDESMIEVARRQPKTPEELRDIRGVGDRLRSNEAKMALQAVGRGCAADPANYPKVPKKSAPTSELLAVVDVLMAFARLKAKEGRVPITSLVTRDELVSLAEGKRDHLEILTGWQYEMAGRELLEMLEGKLSIRVCASAVLISNVEP